MDDSFTSTKKYPHNTPPNENWTIEQLLYWSLDQYHNAAIMRTQSHMDNLRLQCENECEDILSLHELAVAMRERGELMLDDDDEEEGEGGIIGGKEEVAVVAAVAVAVGENADPQRVVEGEENDQHHLKPAAVASNVAITTAASSSSISQATKPKSTTSTTNTLQITILSGPHSSQMYKLQPKLSQPCLIGRSKGKKFLRNGISLSKDQEVSTTHGKISIEQVVVTDDNNDGDDNDGVGGGGVQYKFYYTDVGSTNGTTVGDVRLEPNVRMEIEEGVEVRVGNSILKMMFG